MKIKFQYQDAGRVHVLGVHELEACPRQGENVEIDGVVRQVVYVAYVIDCAVPETEVIVVLSR